MRDGRRRLPALLLVLVTGLLVVHGFVAHLHGAPDPGGDPVAHVAEATSGLAAPVPVDATERPVVGGASAMEPGADHGASRLGHVLALCAAVLVAAGAGMAWWLVSRPLGVLGAPVAPVTAWRPRRAHPFRPPGPGRLELCILRI